MCPTRREVAVAEALRQERETFLAMVRGPESTALRHVFFAEREVQKVLPINGAAAFPIINHVGIVGFGTMGSGIAVAFASAGFSVLVVDETSDAVERGLGRVRATYEAARAKGRISDSDCGACIARVRGSVDYADLAPARIW